LRGGAEGLLGEVVLNPDTARERKLHSKESVRLQSGDVVSFRCSGSGGVGEPAERPRERVELDVREGVVTREAARRDYGAET
jgi:N-methylhydantoinase B